MFQPKSPLDEHLTDDVLACAMCGYCRNVCTVFDAIPWEEEAEATGAEYLVTNCAGCGAQFNATCHAMGTKVSQMDLTELVAKALDIPTTDPSEKVAALGSELTVTAQACSREGVNWIEAILYKGKLPCLVNVCRNIDKKPTLDYTEGFVVIYSNKGKMSR